MSFYLIARSIWRYQGEEALDAIGVSYRWRSLQQWNVSGRVHRYNLSLSLSPEPASIVGRGGYSLLGELI